MRGIRKYLTGKRTVIFRGVVAGLLWLLLVGCFLTSVKTLGTVAKAVDYIEGKALTPEAFQEQQLASEIARGFAVEWATFDGSDTKGYAERLKQYAGKNYSFTPPKGVQTVSSASVLSVENVEDLYRVKLALHISRAVNLERSEAAMASQTKRIPGLKVASAAEAAEGDSDDAVAYWKDFISTVEVSVKINSGEMIVIGQPVISPFPGIKGEKPGSDMDMDEVPEDFKVFVSQALDIYYSGKDMANFIAPGAEINTLGGYTLENATVSVFEQDNQNAKAIITIEISTDGISSLQQTVTLEAVKGDRWLLKRLGGW